MPKVLTPTRSNSSPRGLRAPHPRHVRGRDRGAARPAGDFRGRDRRSAQGNVGHKTHLLFAWLADVVHHPVILDAVEDLYGPDLFCWSSSFFIKEPRNPAFVSWHQDSTYWGLNRADVVTAWFALSPSTRASGAMEVIPGTHRLEQIPHRDTFAKDNLLTRGQEVAAEVDPAKAVTLELRPGEISLHHVLLVHGSAPDLSDIRRVGFAARYIPTSSDKPPANPTPPRLCVAPMSTAISSMSRATRDLDPAFVALHREIAERNARLLYRGICVKSFAQTAR